LSAAAISGFYINLGRIRGMDITETPSPYLVVAANYDGSGDGRTGNGDYS